MTSSAEQIGCRCGTCGNWYRVELSLPTATWKSLGLAPNAKVCGLCLMGRIELELGGVGGFGYMIVSELQLARDPKVLPLSSSPADAAPRWSTADLDRCEHGRHASDSCFNCPDGQSTGNLFITTQWMGAVRIGTTVRGEPIYAQSPGSVQT